MQRYVRSVMMCFAATAGWGQQAPNAAPPRPLAFEVASVKIAVAPEPQPMFCIVPCSPGERLTVQGSRVEVRYMSLHKLIVTAYGIKPYQLSGPDWMRSERFDIMSRMPEGAGKDRVPEMLRALLTERFKLSIHRDSKEQPVYALVVGKNGLKLKESVPMPETTVPAAATAGRAMYSGDGEVVREEGGIVVKGGTLGPIRSGRGRNGNMQIELFQVNMAGLAELVAPHVERPVVDMTERKGDYHFLLELPPPTGGPGSGGRKGGRGAPGDAAPDADSASNPFDEAMFKALENAGLKLEPRKAPVEMIVVDHLEKVPTEN